MLDAWILYIMVLLYDVCGSFCLSHMLMMMYFHMLYHVLNFHVTRFMHASRIIYGKIMVPYHFYLCILIDMILSCVSSLLLMWICSIYISQFMSSKLVLLNCLLIKCTKISIFKWLVFFSQYAYLWLSLYVQKTNLIV